MLNNNTPIKPITDTILSMIVQDKNVSFIETLKYSLNIQKPVSFTCEQKMLPEPMARIMRLGSACMCDIRGAIMPAAVKPATVAEPRHKRIIAAINQPKTKGFICSV